MTGPVGDLCTGVASDLARRVWKHREGPHSGIRQRYQLRRLALAERYEAIATAIQWETSIERWPRARKVNPFGPQNPLWEDMFERLNG